MEELARLRRFRVSIYRRTATPGIDEPENVYTGDSDWTRAATVDGPGFTTFCSIDLRPQWEAVLAGRLTHYEATVFGYETIVKFGQTMAWQPQLRVVIDAEFEER